MVRWKILKIHIQTVTAKETINELENSFEIIAANATMKDIEKYVSSGMRDHPVLPGTFLVLVFEGLTYWETP